MIFTPRSDREAALEAALRECADDLAQWLEASYKPSGQPIHPSQQRRYERDMEPVLRARALLEKKS